MAGTTVKFDHADPGISDQLLDWGLRLQRASPIAYSEAHGGFWIASRYQDIVTIMRDTQTFICSQRITLPPQKSPVPVVPLESDEPDHTFYRSVLAPFLTQKAVRQYEDRIRNIVIEALHPIIERGGGDAMTEFAARIPTRAMAMVFGFSDDDAYRFDSGFSALVDAAGSGDTQRQIAAVESFRSFLLEKLADGRSRPDESSLVTAILRHEVAGRTYTEDEQLGLMWSAAGGAIDTTKLAIGHAIRELGIDRATRRKLTDNPALIPAAVEDSLRLNAPAFMTARYVAKPVTLAGATLKPGDRVLLVYGWGNRDETAFPCPRELQLDRPPNKHLTFGHGIHLCVGMHLAKLELKIVLEEVLARIPDYELVNPAAGPVLHGGMMWGFDTLPIRTFRGNQAEVPTHE
jgi:cytochrome P450